MSEKLANGRRKFLHYFRDFLEVRRGLWQADKKNHDYKGLKWCDLENPSVEEMRDVVIFPYAIPQRRRRICFPLLQSKEWWSTKLRLPIILHFPL